MVNNILIASSTAWAWPWWGILVAISLMNLSIGAFIWYKSVKAGVLKDRYRLMMLIFGTIFIVIGSYRTVFVSSYLEQLAWFDTFFNSSLFIRSIATVAELSYASVIILTLQRISEQVPAINGHSAPRKEVVLYEKIAPYFFISCLFIAQFFATSATITKIHVLFAIEETLWGLAFLAILPLSIMQCIRVFSFKDKEMQKRMFMFRVMTVFFSAFCVGYCIYSLGFHLPVEYWPAAIAQLQMDVPMPEIRHGWQAIVDAFTVVNVTHDFDTWGGIGFMIWHTGYFSLCVWMTLFMMCGPRILKTKSLNGLFEAEDAKIEQDDNTSSINDDNMTSNNNDVDDRVVSESISDSVVIKENTINIEDLINKNAK